MIQYLVELIGEFEVIYLYINVSITLYLYKRHHIPTKIDRSCLWDQNGELISNILVTIRILLRTNTSNLKCEIKVWKAYFHICNAKLQDSTREGWSDRVGREHGPVHMVNTIHTWIYTTAETTLVRRFFSLPLPSTSSSSMMICSPFLPYASSPV